MSAARPGARPRPGRRLPAAVFNARITARLTPRSASAVVALPRNGSIPELRDCKRTLLVTYRRDGTPVPTPVWAAQADGRFYVRTDRTAGKVKRLRNDPRLLVAPCTKRGSPLGAPLEATARLLPAEDEPLAERTLAARYGRGRALFEWAMDVLRVDMGYLEITPAAWGEIARI